MPQSVYNQYIQDHSNTLATLQKLKNKLAWVRFITVVATFILAYYGFQSGIALGIAAIIFGIGSFLFLVSKDVKNNRAIININTLININKEELAILDYKYFHRENGSQFLQPTHAYANDLDVFGNASLYQYINRCNTQQGKALLADNLLTAIPKESIDNRQAAIKELKHKTQWQQHFQAIGQQSTITIATQQKIDNWVQNEEQYLQANYWKILLPLYIVFTFVLLGLYMFDIIKTYQFSAIVTGCLVFAFYQSKKVMKAYELLSKIVIEISVVQLLIQAIEEADFTSPTLQNLQQKLAIHNSKASQEIKRLKNILNLFDVRLNVYLFLFLNTFLLWDVWQIRALNKWKHHNKTHVKIWFDVIAEMEVLNTLSILSFNHPQWCVPTISDTHFTFGASNLGHPLINVKQSVTNSFTTDGIGKIILITGSNMAGKSTFLRSIGCNTVLALMGSVVCADSFTISQIKLMSSMRIADNLAENTSTFYAELKKLQSIIEAVNKHEKLFILLDEILRGTNSLDRHTGSKALIKQLIKQDAIAILATHDIELAKEELIYTENISNFHFDVQVANDELYFDYKLKTGICKSLNASILMRKIGIEMDA
ncbi:MAG: hypothetical protein H7068_07260 [Pedobacter sp.]|nr:hypothetical protein [Chitinophagaceae bacterium]